jgi:hypothetical protein
LGLKTAEIKHYDFIKISPKSSKTDIHKSSKELKPMNKKKSKEYEDAISKDICIKKKFSADIELKCDIPSLIYSSKKADK